MALFVSSAAQRGVFGVWIAFGPGSWPIRLLSVIIASACLYGAMQVPLSVPVETWRDVLIPYAAMPLDLLSFAAPLAVVAIWSGRRLQQLRGQSNSDRDSRHFAISDLLWVTAVVAAAIALARWKDAVRGPGLSAAPNSVVASCVASILSTLYTLPVLWATLVVRRWPRAMLSVGFLTTLFAAPILFASDDADTWPMVIGAAFGFLLTIPCSLLFWRFFGYRLVRTGPKDR